MSRYDLIKLDTDSKTWQELHVPTNCYFTSSIIPDILGFGYNSCAKRYDLMTGNTELPEKTSPFLQAVQQFGNDTEPIAIEKWYELHPEYTGIKAGVAKYNEYIMASCDQILLHKEHKTLHLLEIKCTVTPREFNDGRDIPTKWIAQCQMEMLCWNIHSCYLFIYQGEKEKNYIFKIEYHPEAVQRILNEIEEFIDNHLRKGIRPTRKYKDQLLVKQLHLSAIHLQD